MFHIGLGRKIRICVSPHGLTRFFEVEVGAKGDVDSRKNGPAQLRSRLQRLVPRIERSSKFPPRLNFAHDAISTHLSPFGGENFTALLLGITALSNRIHNRDKMT